jgi:hypothetical protein
MTNDEFQAHVVEELAVLKTHMVSLVGNGQPGRIAKLEDAVNDHQRSINIARGMGAAIATLWAIAMAWLHYHPYLKQ